MSTSLLTRKRRRHDHQSMSDDESDIAPTQKQSKISNWPAEFQETLLHSTTRFRVLSAVGNLFAEHFDQAAFARQSWVDANKATGQNLEVSPEILKLVRFILHHLLAVV